MTDAAAGKMTAMESVFDRVDSTTCAQCGGTVGVSAVPPLSSTPCPDCGQPVTAPARLGTLLLLGQIGRGSAGVVYKALDQTLHRHVAVKLLVSDNDADHQRIVDATVAEARALAAMNHPNVVHVHTIGMRQGQPYIVMELLLGGGKLNVMLKEGWVADERRSLEIGIDVAEALKAAHAAGLLHRDVKPGNILFNDEGTAKLLDFSVSFEAQQAAPDGKRVVIGTPYYLSPEAARGVEVDFRTDIYSLGATLFHLVTGRPVFDGETSRQVIRARLVEDAPDIRTLRPEVSPRTAACLARMLGREPDDRFSSHDELLAELRGALNDALHGEAAGAIADLHSALRNEPVEAPAPRAAAARVTAAPTAAPRIRPKQRAGSRPRLIAAAGAVLLLVVGLIILIAGGKSKPPPNDDADAHIVQGGGDDDDDGYIATRSRIDAAQGSSGTDVPATDHRDGGDRQGADSGENGAGQRDGDTPAPQPPDKADPPDRPAPAPADAAQQQFARALAAWEKDVAARLARPDIAWTALAAVEFNAASKAGFEQRPDGSIIVQNKTPATDTYTITAGLPTGVAPDALTAIRLDALPDASLPSGGPGFGDNGNFVLTGFSAAISGAGASGPRAFETAAPTATFHQVNFPPAGAADGKADTGWAVHPRTGHAHVLMLPLRPPPPAPKPATRPDIVIESFEGEKLDGWKVEGDAFRAQPFNDGDVILAGLDGFEGRGMANSAQGTARASGAAREAGRGKLTSKPFTIERRGIGLLIAGGEHANTAARLVVDGEVVRAASGANSHGLRPAVWNVREFAGREATIEILDDNTDRWGYIIVDRIVQTDEVPAADGAGGAGGARLVVTLAFNSKHRHHGLGRFRLSYTVAQSAFIKPILPANIERIVRTAAGKRTAAQKSELAAFYRREVVEGLGYIPPPQAAAPVAPPAGARPGLYARFLAAADGEIADIADVHKLLAAQRAGRDELITLTPTINYLAGKPAGAFKDDHPFPQHGGGAYVDHFAMEATGGIYIPAAGPWSFHIGADDLAELSIAGGKVLAQGGVGVFYAEAPGFFDLRLLFGEKSGDAAVELAAAPGRHDKVTADFRLVGDVKGGGLHVFAPQAPPVAVTGSAQFAAAALPRFTGPPPPALDPYNPASPDGNRFYSDLPQDALILIPKFAQWRYHVGDAPSPYWTHPSFVAGGWALGQAPFGYGGVGLNTVLGQMKGRHTALYLRAPFKLTDARSLGKLGLLAKFDDAAIVYLNGVEVWRSEGVNGAGDHAKLESPAALTPTKTIDLKQHDRLLRSGVNVLAIEVHNYRADDADFTADPVLFAEKVRRLAAGAKVTRAAGWTPKDADLYLFDDAAVLQTRNAKDSRLEHGPFQLAARQNQALYIAVMMRADHPGKCKLIYTFTSQAGKTVTRTLTESNTENEWRAYTFRIKFEGEFKSLRFDPIEHKGKHIAEIKWVRIYGDASLRGRPLHEWTFAADKANNE